MQGGCQCPQHKEGPILEIKTCTSNSIFRLPFHNIKCGCKSSVALWGAAMIWYIQCYITWCLMRLNCGDWQMCVCINLEKGNYIGYINRTKTPGHKACLQKYCQVEAAEWAESLLLDQQCGSQRDKNQGRHPSYIHDWYTNKARMSTHVLSTLTRHLMQQTKTSGLHGSFFELRNYVHNSQSYHTSNSTLSAWDVGLAQGTIK